MESEADENQFKDKCTKCSQIDTIVLNWSVKVLLMPGEVKVENKLQKFRKRYKLCIDHWWSTCIILVDQFCYQTRNVNSIILLSKKNSQRNSFCMPTHAFKLYIYWGMVIIKEPKKTPQNDNKKVYMWGNVIEWPLDDINLCSFSS